MSKEPHEHQPVANDPLLDVSQLVTTRLRARPPHAETDTHQIAQHEAEIQRLTELTEAVEQAVTAVVIRLHIVSDEGVRDALQHNRADLQRFTDELDSVCMEHRRAIERLRERA